MKYSVRLADAIHILVLVVELQDTSSASIAKSCATHPAFVRQIMMKLRKAGLLKSSQGRPKPSLARKASEISLLDVYRAMEGNKPVLHLNTHTNPDCGIGINIQFALGDFYAQLQSDMEAKMKQITLQDVLDSYHERISALKARAFPGDNL